MRKTLSLILLAVMTLTASAAKKAEPMEAYLFVYFTNNHPSGEQLRFAVSMDGYNYTPLNNGAKVYDVCVYRLKHNADGTIEKVNLDSRGIW